MQTEPDQDHAYGTRPMFHASEPDQCSMSMSTEQCFVAMSTDQCSITITITIDHYYRPVPLTITIDHVSLAWPMTMPMEPD